MRRGHLAINAFGSREGGWTLAPRASVSSLTDVPPMS